MSVDHPGFDDPVGQSQTCFRAVLDAMARPGHILPACAERPVPSPLAPATASVLLTLADAETPVWLDPAAAPSAEWLQFHSGAPLAEPAQARFAVCLDLPALDGFDWGSHDGPETSATLILQVPHFAAGPLLRLSGPGLREPVSVRLGLPGDFARRWAPNHAAFPRGLDLILCAGTQLAALPRTCRVEPG